MTTKRTLNVEGQTYTFFSLLELQRQGIGTIERLPFSIRVLLENMLRLREMPEGSTLLGEEADAVIYALANWQPQPELREIPLMPARVILQDFTGVPCVVDLVAMRDAIQARGGDPQKINPVVPADLVIDHSVQVDYFGTEYAFMLNVEKEFERNRERYMLLRWAQQAFDNFRVVPPGTGIVHQVNLEYLGRVVQTKQVNGEMWAFPDSLVGTDSHTTMINALGILGWGVGGIEAEAVMLGQPYYMLIPQVVGVRLTGQLPEGATATDLVLTVTQLLRKKGVVDKFVEFFGPGLSSLTVEDRATIANMAPEYGATMGFFPVDQRTLDYLRFTGRHESLVRLVEAYCKENALFRTDETPDPVYSDLLELDLSTVEPSLAGPKRPHDRVPLREVKPSFLKLLYTPIREGGFGLTEPSNDRWATESPAEATPAERGHAGVPVLLDDEEVLLHHGDVVIAAITSCTNTSNPAVMIAAGLLAKKAVERGLTVKPTVKTSLAPGSRVVTDYLRRRGCCPIWKRCVSMWSATAAPPASATADRCPNLSQKPFARATSWWQPCCRATATLRHASIRWSEQTTSPRPRSSSPTHWRDESTSTSTTSRLGTTRTGSPSTCAIFGPARRRCARPSHARYAPRCSSTATPASLRATNAGAPCPSRKAKCISGTPTAPISSARPTSTGCPTRHHPCRIFTRRACWLSSATASRPTTSRQQAVSQWRVPQGSISSARGLTRAISTPTARGAATTR
jgi:homoaconitase/3-isopropylmalate dehydratase large subunit